MLRAGPSGYSDSSPCLPGLDPVRTGGKCSRFCRWLSISGASTLNKDQIAERGARLARRDDRAYREYVRKEQRSQTGCPARDMVLDRRGRATNLSESQVKALFIVAAKPARPAEDMPYASLLDEASAPATSVEQLV